jgi:hypothetical protein
VGIAKDAELRKAEEAKEVKGAKEATKTNRNAERGKAEWKKVRKEKKLTTHD